MCQHVENSDPQQKLADPFKMLPNEDFMEYFRRLSLLGLLKFGPSCHCDGQGCSACMI